MKTNLISFVGFFLVFLYSQCARQYIAPSVNSPLLTNKGEVQGALNFGASGFDQQFAIAVTDNIGLMAASSFSSQNTDTTSDDYHRHFLAEGGIGYYKTFSNIGRFEIYGGYGYGNISTRITEIWQTKISDNTYNKIFIQPGFGSSSSFFDISLSPRMALIFMEGYNPTLFLEPIFASKVGFKYVFLTSQFGLSFPISKNENMFIYQPLMFNIGILFKFGKIYDENSSF